MANVREIRKRMKSIEETMQITNAMYLIASSKLKKARKQLSAVEPYFTKVQSTICDILSHTPDAVRGNQYFDQRTGVKDKKRGYLVITADKGLSGVYNHNIMALTQDYMKDTEHNSFFVIGQVGRQLFQQKKVPIDGEFLYAAQDPNLYRAEEIAQTLLRLFQKKLLDEVYVIFTNMESPIKLTPEIFRLLPLDESNFDPTERVSERYNQVATYVPSAEAVMENLVPNYVKGIIFGCLVESYSSEHSARMTAMDAATKSAKDMLKTLSLAFNRARQAAITQEITEIVGGAEANAQSR